MASSLPTAIEQNKPKLLDQVRQGMRLRHYSILLGARPFPRAREGEEEVRQSLTKGPRRQMQRQKLKCGRIIAPFGRALRDSPVLAAAALAFFPGLGFRDGFLLRFRSPLRLGSGLGGFPFHMESFAMGWLSALAIFTHTPQCAVGCSQKQ